MDPFTKGAIIGAIAGLFAGGVGGVIALALVSLNRPDAEDEAAGGEA